MIKILFFTGGLLGFSILNAQLAVIKVPISNLRITPTLVNPQLTAPALSEDMGSRETGQISQCLFNELVQINDTTQAPPGWTKITALEQETAFDGPIPSGFIQTDHLQVVPQEPNNTVIIKQPYITPTKSIIPLGSYLPGIKLQDQPATWLVTLPDGSTITIPETYLYSRSDITSWTEQQMRDAVITVAEQFLTTMFVWGGRSLALPEYTDQITGVDNSGFIHLVFRTVGINIPRNSKHILYKGLNTIIAHGKNMQPGDIIFFVRPNLLTSVALYLGNNMIMFATGNPTSQDFSSKHHYTADVQKKLSVQKASLSDFFSNTLSTLNNGDIPLWHDTKKYPQGTRICFSSFITNNPNNHLQGE